MSKKSALWVVMATMVIFSMLISACQPAVPAQPEAPAAEAPRSR